MKNKIYCIYCGKENKITDSKCSKCNEKLDPKDNSFLMYLKSKIEDDFVGNVEDKVSSIIINFIKSHLYGFILTCSVIISGTFIVVNNVNNYAYVSNVDTKPTLAYKYEYAGSNLSSLDVAKMYVDAIENNDKELIKSLQLETFYPDVYEELKSLKFVNYYSEDVFDEYFPILEHNLVDNGEYFFKDNLDSGYIGESELVRGEGTFGDYTFNRYMFRLNYCIENNCDLVSEYDVHFSIGDQIELLLVDGNYYVVGEQTAGFMGQDQEIMYYLLLKNEGDTSRLTDEQRMYYFNKCTDGSTKDCVYDK